MDQNFRVTAVKTKLTITRAVVAVSFSSSSSSFFLFHFLTLDNTGDEFAGQKRNSP